NVTSIAAGGYHSLALVTDPTLPVGPIAAPLPLNRAVMAGTDVTLRALASGGLLHYQWQCDVTSVPGPTASTLALARASFSQSGSYSVLISNSAGTIRSSAITLLIWPSLNLARFENALAASWEGPFTLQSAGSTPAGPYLDVAGA